MMFSGDTATLFLLLLLMPLNKGWLGNITIGFINGQENNTDSTTTILRRLLNENNMDPRIRPNVEGDAVEVKCGFFVVSFGSVSEVNMDYTMNIYLRQQWHDDRMMFNKAKVLSLSAKAIEKMWTPDLFFPNEKQASFHVVTTPNQLMKVYPDGKVIYSIRLTLKLSCPMNLENFPMDHQLCNFKLESYSMNVEEMILHWFNDTPVEVSKNVELPQFDLVGWDHGDCETSYKTGKFPCLQASFKLKRQFGFFLLQTYVPTILIVILSWVSFWINMEAVPARISLGVTTVLTMATQLSGSKAAIPRVSYPKAIDVWMSMCMLFVFLALVEYAFVNAMSRKNKPDSAKQQRASDSSEAEKTTQGVKEPLVDNLQTVSIKGASGEYLICYISKAPRAKDEDLPTGLQLLNIRKVFSHRQAARILDKTSRVLFPSIFVLFNLVYWPVYLQHKLWE